MYYKNSKLYFFSNLNIIILCFCAAQIQCATFMIPKQEPRAKTWQVSRGPESFQ